MMTDSLFFLGFISGVGASGIIFAFFAIRINRKFNNIIRDQIKKTSINIIADRIEKIDDRDQILIQEMLLQYRFIANESNRQIYSLINSVLNSIISVIGIVSLIVVLIKQREYFIQIFGHIFVAPAYAASSGRAALDPYVPLFIMTILSVLGAVFILSILIICFVKDNSDNASKIRMADTMIKMLGGFFTGLATSLLS